MTSANNPEKDPTPLPVRGHAAELGLASLILAAVLFLAAPITLILAVQVWQFADQGRATVHLHAWLARASVSIALLTSGGSFAFGIMGLRSAIRHGRPKGLSFAGLLLSLAAFGLWIITTIGLLNATESLLYLHGG